MKTEKFKVFDNEKLGRFFMPENLDYEMVKAVNISPFHGRAVALKKDEYEWISVKGGGWNYGGPQIYLCKKDEELVFGLYPLISAERELAVSLSLEKISDDFPKVLYFKNICDAPLPKRLACLPSLRFANGEKVNPCLLYTRLKSPIRIADFIYFSPKERKNAVKHCCKFWKIPAKDYTAKFTEKLATQVAIMHKNGFINDTLDYGNVTVLAEIVDYEWVTAPNIKLFDGTYGLELTDARREKEILYGVEICMQLKALLNEKYNLFDIYAEFVAAYRKVNPQFIDGNDFIQKMLKKESIII